MTRTQQMIETSPSEAPMDVGTLSELIDSCFECARAVKLCGDECEQHAEHHEHCRVCMEACRRCEEACNSVLSAIPA
jgi:hypothetical protein